MEAWTGSNPVEVLTFAERARALLVSPVKKNRIKWRHFGVNFLLPWRVCCRVRVSSRAVKVCQNKQITGKIPIRDSKECKQQAIEFNKKKWKLRFMWLTWPPAFAAAYMQRCRIHWFYIKLLLRSQIFWETNRHLSWNFVSPSLAFKLFACENVAFYTKQDFSFHIYRYQFDSPSSSESKELRVRLLEIEANAVLDN